MLNNDGNVGLNRPLEKRRGTAEYRSPFKIAIVIAKNISWNASARRYIKRATANEKYLTR